MGIPSLQSKELSLYIVSSLTSNNSHFSYVFALV
jgi:hypothetical protein